MSPTKEKVYLNVPFKEKDQAKELGAWWDPNARKWFVPKGKEFQPFEKWMVEENGERRGG